jgi:DnaK suppressor protein
MHREKISREMERTLRVRKEEINSWIKKEMRKNMAAENRLVLGAGQEEGDCATASQSDYMHFLNMSSQHVIMKQIERALRKIEEGSYGFCEECASEIGVERLRILPVAVYCRDCQELLEERRGINYQAGRNWTAAFCR